VYVLCGCPIAQRCNGYWVDFITERKCVYCAEHESSCIMHFTFNLTVLPLSVITSYSRCPSRAHLSRNLTQWTRCELEHFWQDICLDTQLHIMARRLCCCIEVHYFRQRWTPQYRHGTLFTCGRYCILLHTFYSLIQKNDRVLVGKPEGKRPLGRPRLRWEDNIKIDVPEVEGGRGDWMELA
jgi:hypothetical protein